MEGTSMTDDERFARWGEWLDVICDQVQRLRLSRYVYNRVQQIVANNAAIQQSSLFYDCYATDHACSAVIGVRRALDYKSPTISLARLLDDISKFPGVLSR